MKTDIAAELIAMNARQCEALTMKAARCEADGTETGQLKGAYLRAAAQALASGRSRKVLLASGAPLDPDNELKLKRAQEEMGIAKRLLAARGITVKERRG
jgi:hypothetical protein